MTSATNPVIASITGAGCANIVNGVFCKRSYQTEATKQTANHNNHPSKSPVQAKSSRPMKAPKREWEPTTMYKPMFFEIASKDTTSSHANDGFLHAFELVSTKDQQEKQFKVFKVASTNHSLKKKIDKHEICNFLDIHLGEFGDGKEAIMENIEMALQQGSLFLIKDNSNLVAVLVISDTGFNKTMPKNFIGYVAVHHTYRDEYRGLGKKLLEACYDNTTGDICLHCEKSNPRAIRVYESMGFIPKYLEMRWSRSEWESSKE